MIKVFEAFAGYGSQSMALRRLGIDFEVVGISEIDKYAIQAYMAVHGDTPNYGDISKIDWSSVPDFDFLTYSFPCTDISTAGQQKGLAEGSGTRSSLLWECRKAIEAKRPKYLLMENVKNLVSKKFIPYLKEWLRFLEGQGYSNYTKVFNAKDFGVPQNRERVFMVSILGEASFHFPKPFTLEKRLKDVLEKDVDESFYLSEKIVKTFLARNEKNKAKGNGFKFEPTMGNVIASSILTNAGSRDCDNFVYVETTGDFCAESDSFIMGISVHPNSRKLEFKGLESISDISPTLRSTDYKCPHTVWEINDKSECVVYKGRVLKEGDGLYLHNSDDFNQGSLDGISRTLKATKFDAGVVQNYRIRKLTPREYFRLMGVSEEDIDNIQQSGISKTQQYKMAGNSIVVDVLYYIFKKMFVDKSCEDAQLSLF